MLLAVRPRLAALDIEARRLCARAMRAPLAADIHHAVLGMLLAVRRRVAALDVVARHLITGVL